MNAKSGTDINLEYIENLDNQKNFDNNKVFECLKLTINFLKDNPENISSKLIHHARMNFETILFGTYILEFNDIETYKHKLLKIDKSSLRKLGL